MRVTILLLLAAALAGAGCSGDDDDDQGDGPSYREQAIALCEDATDLIQEIPPPGSAAGIADYLERVIESSADYADDYEQLEPPAELRADHDAAARVGRRIQARLEELLERVRESNQPAVTAARGLEALVRGADFRRSERLLRRLGLEKCLSVAAPANPTPA